MLGCSWIASSTEKALDQQDEDWQGVEEWMGSIMGLTKGDFA